MPLPTRRRRLLLFAARCYTRVLMRRPPEDWSVPQADGRYGPAEGEGLRLVLLGDSLAQGVGVRRAEETLGARLAVALAEALDRPVDLRVPARAGGTTRTLLRQAARTATGGSTAAGAVTHPRRAETAGTVRRVATAGAAGTDETAGDTGGVARAGAAETARTVASRRAGSPPAAGTSRTAEDPAPARLRPGVAVVLVGGNDAMAPLPLGAAARRFGLALGLLADAGWRLVVVPCPDPHDAPGFRVLPRLLASPRSRRLKHRQLRAAERVGALVAPSSTAPFLERAEELLSADGVHPSAAGYADYAERMFPVLLAAAHRCGTLPERAVLGS